MSAEQYAETAEKHWTTYRPAATAQIPPSERAAFFASLGQQVEEMVTYLAADNLQASSRPKDDPLTTERRRAMAHARAEEEALGELVYLPVEPGTEERQLPLTPGLAATTDDPQGAPTTL